MPTPSSRHTSSATNSNLLITKCMIHFTWQEGPAAPMQDRRPEQNGGALSRRSRVVSGVEPYPTSTHSRRTGGTTRCRTMRKRHGKPPAPTPGLFREEQQDVLPEKGAELVEREDRQSRIPAEDAYARWKGKSRRRLPAAKKKVTGQQYSEYSRSGPGSRPCDTLYLKRRLTLTHETSCCPTITPFHPFPEHDAGTLVPAPPECKTFIRSSSPARSRLRSGRPTPHRPVTSRSEEESRAQKASPTCRPPEGTV